MGQLITALKVQKRNQNRVNVYLDGSFAFGLSRIVAAWLNIGQELSDDKIASLITEDEQEVAYQRALRFLSYRQRSSVEITQQLRKAGISALISQATLMRLEKNGLINDSHFAESWVENRNEFRPRSHRMLAVELRQKGIEPEIIAEVLEATIPDEELAYLAAQKQKRKTENLEWESFRRKLSSHLARRGFSYGTIQDIVQRVWEE
jgi:regulatory protein